MNMLKYFFSACMAMLCMQSHADGEKSMVINMMNQNDNIYILLENDPTINVHGDLLEVQSENYTIANINKNAVREIRYEEVILSAVENLMAEEVNVTPKVTHDYVYIKGLSGNTQIRLFNLNGEKYTMGIRHYGNEAVVDMSTLVSGVYLLEINQQSFKITKK